MGISNARNFVKLYWQARVLGYHVNLWVPAGALRLKQRQVLQLLVA